MKLNCAWVTITGKVFVDSKDVQEAIGTEHDVYGKLENEYEAFQALAQDAIREKYCLDDDPVKVVETEIDLSTLR